MTPHQASDVTQPAGGGGAADVLGEAVGVAATVGALEVGAAGLASDPPPGSRAQPASTANATTATSPRTQSPREDLLDMGPNVLQGSIE
jgi:hypothetical protein